MNSPCVRLGIADHLAGTVDSGSAAARHTCRTYRAEVIRSRIDRAACSRAEGMIVKAVRAIHERVANHLAGGADSGREAVGAQATEVIGGWIDRSVSGRPEGMYGSAAGC